MKPCIDCAGNNITPEQTSEWKEGVCDVCRMIDKDTTMKQVKHCEFCNADLCAACAPRFDKRIVAAFMEAWNKKFKTK